ncbi:MAG: DUF4115 domain-containing protein [Anaerolineae bacterium]|nr:DUF4115 domain-containing protein [Anaerolineae bacterium]
MQNIGKWLQTAREAKGLTLDDVENVTKIRSRYLKALESGDYSAIPGGEAQTRGFLRRYAGLLGLPTDEAISRYEQETTGRVPVLTAPPPEPEKPAPSSFSLDLTPSRLAMWQIAAIAGVVLLLALGGWWLVSTVWPEAAAPTPTQVAQAGTAWPTIEATASVIGADATGEAVPTFPANPEGVTLTLEPQEHVWVRVTVDSVVVFEGLLAPGAPQTWMGESVVMVETGNGAGVVAVVNGQVQGPVGGRGQLSARGWDLQGEVSVSSP